eukprot:gene57413-biopygen20563
MELTSDFPGRVIVLTVAGTSYIGSDGPNGVVVDTTTAITWESDHSLQEKGFRICLQTTCNLSDPLPSLLTGQVGNKWVFAGFGDSPAKRSASQTGVGRASCSGSDANIRTGAHILLLVCDGEDACKDASFATTGGASSSNWVLTCKGSDTACDNFQKGDATECSGSSCTTTLSCPTATTSPTTRFPTMAPTTSPTSKAPTLSPTQCDTFAIGRACGAPRTVLPSTATAVLCIEECKKTAGFQCCHWRESDQRCRGSAAATLGTNADFVAALLCPYTVEPTNSPTTENPTMTPVTNAQTNPPTAAPAFTSTGSCVVDSDCITSSGYPGNYGSRENCDITPQRSGALVVESFITESVTWDKLTVAGIPYGGSNGPNGVVVGTTTTMTWVSDGSVEKKGFRICLPTTASPFTWSATLRNYDDSKAWCESRGMLIASIHSDEENAQMMAAVTYGSAYLGAVSDGSGNWHWEDGSAWDYTPAANDGLLGVGETRIACLQQCTGDCAGIAFALAPSTNTEGCQAAGMGRCLAPTTVPTDSPSTKVPTAAPRKSPITKTPTKEPMASPTTKGPSDSPTTKAPTTVPTDSPSTKVPTAAPTKSPITKTPTKEPMASPTTKGPSDSPTTKAPSKQPTGSPSTKAPSESPTTCNVGHVNCIGEDACKDDGDIGSSCPVGPGTYCRIMCEGKASCSGNAMIRAGTHTLLLVCDGEDACKDAKFSTTGSASTSNWQQTCKGSNT